MKNIISSISIVSILFLSTLSESFAACNPATDACAPKKVIDAWEKSVSAGFNLTRGNTETVLLTLGGAARKEDKEGNIYDFAGAFNYGEDNAIEKAGGDKVTRNDFRANGRYDKLLDDRWYLGIGSSFLNDELADLDYRITIDPSPGYYVLKNDDFKLRFEAGPSYVFEKSGGETNNYLAPRIADRFDWIISCTSKFYQKAEVLFDLDESSNYIVNAEIGIEAALSTDLAMVFTVRNVMDNQPAPDREKNDLQTISSLKVSL
jgi:putative salt-induced outer membrane protein YdiY